MMVKYFDKIFVETSNQTLVIYFKFLKLKIIFVVQVSDQYDFCLSLAQHLAMQECCLLPCLNLLKPLFLHRNQFFTEVQYNPYHNLAKLCPNPRFWHYQKLQVHVYRHCSWFNLSSQVLYVKISLILLELVFQLI